MSIQISQTYEERLRAKESIKKAKTMKKRVIVLPKGKYSEFDALKKAIENIYFLDVSAGAGFSLSF